MLTPTFIDSMIHQQQSYYSDASPTFIDSMIQQQQSYQSDASPYLH